MAVPCVWLCVLVSMVMTVGATTPVSPPLVKNCQDDVLSAMMQTAGCTPSCVAYSLSLCSQVQRQNHFVEEIRDIMWEPRPPMTPCQGTIIEEGKPRPQHCQDLLEEGDTGHGVRLVYPYPEMPDEGVAVYCDHTVDGGGWLVLQRRINATTREDFYRTWAEYQQGFGNLTGEFWLGLNHLHVLTSSSPQQIRFDLSDYEGEQRWAKYSVFKVGPPEDNYRLTIEGYTGDAGDAMAFHKGQQFSTHDADHDNSSTWLSGNCAQDFTGAWWYKDCHHANLNGYQHEGANSPFGKGITWYPWKITHNYSYMSSTMLIRPAP